jgi:hypothetical protein
MKDLKNKIIDRCLLVGVLMTLFPPQQIQTLSSPDAKVYGEKIEYRFIGGGERFISGSLYETSKIAFDRLLLQYLILAGVGYGAYLTFANKDDE